MSRIVESVTRFHRLLVSENTPSEKEALERQIAGTDAQIDALVYELYGLTDAEIAVVEKAENWSPC